MQKKNKRSMFMFAGAFLVLLITIIMVLSGIQKIAEKEYAKTDDTSTESSAYSVAVQAGDYTGQGVVYAIQENTTYILTTKHLMQGIEKGEYCTVILENGERTEAALIYLSEAADAAFLMMVQTEGLMQVPVNRSRFDGLMAGDLVTACYLEEKTSMQLQGEILYPWIYLEDFSLNMMLLNMDVKAGMSGCAILDAEGYFAGIVCGINEEGETAVLPLSVVESEWLMTGGE